jgi:hypothetical protein
LDAIERIMYNKVNFVIELYRDVETKEAETSGIK